MHILKYLMWRSNLIHKQDYYQSQKCHSAHQESELDSTLEKKRKRKKKPHYIRSFYKVNNNSWLEFHIRINPIPDLFTCIMKIIVCVLWTNRLYSDIIQKRCVSNEKLLCVR
jgi:hypothetical protein